MKIVSQIAVMVLMIAGAAGIAHAIGPETLAGMRQWLFGDYIAFWDYHISGRLPGVGNPLVIILIAATVAAVLPSFLPLSRFLATVMIAYVTAKLAVMATGAEGLSPPSLSLSLAGLFALGWLFMLAAIGDRSLILWIKERRRAGAS